MSGLLFFIIAILLVGFILLSGRSPDKKTTRDQFLKDLARFLEGTLEPIEDGIYENSFRIRFDYGGEKFVYEDLEKPSFKDKVYFAHLKVKTPSNLTLTFSEKKRGLKIRTDIFISSEISTKKIGKHVQLEVPDHLKDLNIYTNDKIVANHFFEDKKIITLFKQLKNTDMRGYSFLPVEIVDGTVCLAFSSEKIFHPNVFEIKSDIPLIEDYTNKLLIIVQRLKKEL